jgi:hypothetical protein
MAHLVATDVTKDHRPLWSRLADRFPNARECLAAYVALETAEILAEAKPASLLSIPNRQRACGKNLYMLWREHGSDLLNDTPLGAWELVDRGGSLMLLFYHKERLELHLSRRDISALLLRAGYCAPFTTGVVLRQLAERSRTGQFPHEIGLLLGYPPKDVAAFMGWIRLPFTCQGPWKIYGNPTDSLRLAERFRHCRSAMAEQLALCSSAIQFLGELAGNRHRFFVPAY